MRINSLRSSGFLSDAICRAVSIHDTKIMNCKGRANINGSTTAPKDTQTPPEGKSPISSAEPNPDAKPLNTITASPSGIRGTKNDDTSIIDTNIALAPAPFAKIRQNDAPPSAISEMYPSSADISKARDDIYIPKTAPINHTEKQSTDIRACSLKYAVTSITHIKLMTAEDTKLPYFLPISDAFFAQASIAFITEFFIPHSSRADTASIVVPPGEHTMSFKTAGAIPLSSMSFALPKIV